MEFISILASEIIILIIFCSVIVFILGLIIFKKYNMLSKSYKKNISFIILDWIIPFYQFDIYYYLYKKDYPESKIIIYRIIILLFKIFLFFILLLIILKIHFN